MDKPLHIGVIMDGNRRWGQANNVPLIKAYEFGVEKFKEICKWCLEYKIKFLSVYAFSIENWNRSQTEIDCIFSLLIKFLKFNKESFIKNKIRVRIIGDRTKLNKKIIRTFEEVESQNVDNFSLFVYVAFGYGSRNEIVNATKSICKDALCSKLDVEQISEHVFSNYLSTKQSSDIDLIIRTGGEQNRRLSNFMLWQSAYSELYFSDLLWPDFSKSEFKNALDYYAVIDRKHGT